jgi:hypothetical protein
MGKYILLEIQFPAKLILLSFDPVDGQPASKGSAFLYDIELEEEPENVGAVVVGYEKYFNYLKLMKSANYLRVCLGTIPHFPPQLYLFPLSE